MKKIVILGAGFAGLRALHFLQAHKGDYHITLVDRNSYHYETIDLEEVAAGTQPKEKILYPIKDIIKSSITTFIQAKVEKVNRKKQEVELSNKQTLTYDYLIISLGFRSETFGIPGAEKNALQMVDPDTAVSVHDHLIASMKDYKKTKDLNDLKIVVCGAGFTGIELLGQLNDARTDLAKYAEVSPDEIKIYVVEAVTRVLPQFSKGLADYGVSQLKKWGIHFLTGKPIKEIKPNTVIYQDNAKTGGTKELKANSIIWTTGVSGSKVIENSGFSQHRGRVMVKNNLQDPDYNNIYIIGDCSAVMDSASNRPYPTTAQIAIKMGEVAAKNLLAQLSGKETTDFKYNSRGTIASIGNTHAFGTVGKKELRGLAASIMKKVSLDKSLTDTGGRKALFAKGRFDLYH